MPAGASGRESPPCRHSWTLMWEGGGAVTPLSLARAAASPKCFAGKSPPSWPGAADATGFLSTVIKSLANGSGRKK